MQPCDCQTRPCFFDLHPDAVDEFLEGFEQLTHDRLKNFHLFRCSECSSLWVVDDVSRGPMAVRASSNSAIESFDERPYRRELAIAMRGGLSKTKCAFIGCGNHAMGRMAFCVDHQYPQYTASDNAATKT